MVYELHMSLELGLLMAFPNAPRDERIARLSSSRPGEDLSLDGMIDPTQRKSER
jgi:hypothetical protein